MTKACVGILFYNDIDGLNRLIPSLMRIGVSYYDIIAFDGPFDLFDHMGKDKSTDGSREFLEKIGVKIIDCGICTHIEKTNKRFQGVAELGYDTMLVVDCDEYVLGSWGDMLKHLEMCQSKMKYYTYASPFMDLDGFYHERALHQRIFLDPKNLYYQGAHWWVFHKSDPMMQVSRWILGCILIVHDSKVRPKYREDQMKDFQEKHFKTEEDLENIIPNQPSLHKQPCGCMHGYYKYQKPGENTYKMKDISIRCPKHQ